MRYLERPWAQVAEYADHLDCQKLGSATGYIVDELRALGAGYCHSHRPHEMGHMSEATATLVAAAMRQAA